jgi:hypothetical protein
MIPGAPLTAEGLAALAALGDILDGGKICATCDRPFVDLPAEIMVAEAWAEPIERGFAGGYARRARGGGPSTCNAQSWRGFMPTAFCGTGAKCKRARREEVTA